jgi:predicted RNase H-like HicB family nuclease
VVSFDNDGISIHFPDLQGCFTCAENEREIFKMSKEVLGLHLWSMETDNEPMPEPSQLKDICLEPNETSILVEVFMPPVRDRINGRVVKKTLTLPHWLNAEAENAGVNFSQMLQSTLKEYLHTSH